MKDNKFHSHLNPKLWSKDNKIHPEVADKLKQIADAFIESIGINRDAIKDIVITGSSASYNYTPHSDIDLHLLVDTEKVHKDCPIVDDFLISKKSEFNDKHDIYIYGIPVEVYAEDYKNENIHNGLYSLVTNSWIDEPKKLEPVDNDVAVAAKYKEIASAAKGVADKDEAVKLIEKIKKMRKAGLAQGGEFSVENLVFKKLRNEGVINSLMQTKKEGIDKELSLEESLSSMYESIIDETILLLESFPIRAINELEDKTVEDTGKKIWDKLNKAQSVISSKQLYKDIDNAVKNKDEKKYEELQKIKDDAIKEVAKRKKQLETFKDLNAKREERKAEEREAIERVRNQYQDPAKVYKDSIKAGEDHDDAQLTQWKRKRLEALLPEALYEEIIESLIYLLEGGISVGRWSTSASNSAPERRAKADKLKKEAAELANSTSTNGADYVKADRKYTKKGTLRKRLNKDTDIDWNAYQQAQDAVRNARKKAEKAESRAKHAEEVRDLNLPKNSKVSANRLTNAAGASADSRWHKKQKDLLYNPTPGSAQRSAKRDLRARGILFADPSWEEKHKKEVAKKEKEVKAAEEERKANEPPTLPASYHLSPNIETKRANLEKMLKDTRAQMKQAGEDHGNAQITQYNRNNLEKLYKLVYDKGEAFGSLCESLIFYVEEMLSMGTNVAGMMDRQPIQVAGKEQPSYTKQSKSREKRVCTYNYNRVAHKKKNVQ